MNLGKKITELNESSTISGESSYPVSMGDGTGVKQVKHKNLVEQLLSDMELPYDATLAMLMETETDEEGNQKIPNLQAISDWIMSKIVNNLLATEEGFFLDARIGRILDQRISANANAISQINSDLAKTTVCISGYCLGNNSATISFKPSHNYILFFRDNVYMITSYSKTLEVWTLIDNGGNKVSIINNNDLTITITTLDAGSYIALLDVGFNSNNFSGQTISI
ncbi:MAG: hypothetical protein HDR09_12895 [Lachnospiraceae bacterium]|nr:hypothetical protein [Lachnospiraceae bacterium]